MSTKHAPSGCACCPMNRRGFIAGCATCVGAMAVPKAGLFAADGAKKKRIRLIYALLADVQTKATWPNVGFEFVPVMERMTKALVAGRPEIEFIPTKVNDPEQAKAILEKDKSADIDGYLVIHFNNRMHCVIHTLLTSGKPILYADFLYGGSGLFLTRTAGLLRRGVKNFGFISSTEFANVVEAARCFLTIEKPDQFAEAVAKVRKAQTQVPGGQDSKPDEMELLSPLQWQERMHQSKILTVGGKGWRGPKPVIEELGVQVAEVSYAEVNDAWKLADKGKSEQVADMWAKRARKIADVSREELQNSAAMYLGMKRVLKKHAADAIAINCLGGFYGGHIHAYPCLGFHELCNEGIVGACECDLLSASTMVALKNLTGGRTGFISDPVVDFAKRQIIYAHCVAHNRAFGPRGQDNPIEILTHSEDRKGAAVRSLLPLGYMTTTVQFGAFRKELLFHRGKTVDNIIEDRACRTKLAVEPDGDIEKLMTQWDRFGWHRVTVYGDLKEQLLEIAKMLKWKVTEEV